MDSYKWKSEKSKKLAVFQLVVSNETDKFQLSFLEKNVSMQLSLQKVRLKVTTHFKLWTVLYNIAKGILWFWAMTQVLYGFRTICEWWHKRPDSKYQVCILQLEKVHRGCCNTAVASAYAGLHHFSSLHHLSSFFR